MGKSDMENLDKKSNMPGNDTDDFVVDEEDKKRRLQNIMTQLQKEGKLTLEEEKKLFSRQGYFATGKFPEIEGSKTDAVAGEASESTDTLVSGKMESS